MHKPAALVARLALALLVSLLAACGDPDIQPQPAKPVPKPALLLVTLDTTRADVLTPEVAPSFAALAGRGIAFEQAYSTAPSTLTAHTSMMSGLYPAGHGIHENGRYLDNGVPLLAEELQKEGYSTSAFVSGYPLAGQFGLARGFERYEDDFGEDGAGKELLERSAAATTDKALEFLGWAVKPDRPAPFVWVHYYDPHEPYAPPEPWKSRFAGDPYRGEVAAMDEQLGRLLAGFEKAAVARGADTEFKIVVVADHGEALGDHGEVLHGNLLYQGVMRVPLAIAGSGIAPSVRQDAVSSRQIRATMLGWARRQNQDGSLLAASGAPVLGEAMQPFLNYRWQPQVMAVGDRIKVIRSGRFEIYDVVDDPDERNDLAATLEPDRALLRAIADYPLPAAKSGPALDTLSLEDRQKLASLGYVASESTPTRVPENAPRAAGMTGLFADLDAASHDFVAERYAVAASRFEQILAADPGNLMAAVRLAVSLSLLGRDSQAMSAFARARKIDPDSIEVRHYQAMHYQKTGRGDLAEPLFQQVLETQPSRYAALAGLAEIRKKQGRLAEAADFYEKSLASAPDLGFVRIEIGQLRMELGDTAAAIAAFEAGRNDLGKNRFRHDLELGVLYLAQNDFEAAREALDRVPADHPARPLALFKRAQVAVLLNESDRADRVKLALQEADPETRQLIQNERLFAGLY